MCVYTTINEHGDEIRKAAKSHLMQNPKAVFEDDFVTIFVEPDEKASLFDFALLYKDLEAIFDDPKHEHIKLVSSGALSKLEEQHLLSSAVKI